MSQLADEELSHLVQSTLLEHGDEAPTYARRRAAERLREFDLAGARNWCAIGCRADLMLSRMSRERH